MNNNILAKRVRSFITESDKIEKYCSQLISKIYININLLSARLI